MKGTKMIEKMREFHGMTRTRLYRIYNKMRRRCYCPENHEYHYYGGRGIGVCSEWSSSFIAFYEWAMANGYNDNLTIDRIDHDKGYSPDNCRWVSMKVQNNNRRCNKLATFNNETKTLAEWSDAVGIPYKTLYARVHIYGWSIEDALSHNHDARIYKRALGETI